MKTKVEIFFDDLCEAKQKEVLDLYQIGCSDEMNAEYNPLFILEYYGEEQDV